MYHVHVLGFDDKTTTHKHPSRLYDIMPITPVWDVYMVIPRHLPPLVRNGKYTVQVHRRGISCDAETDEVVERNQCEYDPS